ncbi:DUF6799 domain-containing protein [Hymenobacter sp. GOD-10R]|uniref:DUF6799 domain-containing protein n=1 Tax=Hymenobacter sp. GOD-10R TaxID=3093922 RepID=UPI002D773A04|nr:DUF6799 domain-containing protein [Hymenobacter sp. GOD-10R]WRQ28744.1 DUF6799 domain-containing protein [Hymenobacter sp. GOD-10R]
MKNPLVRTSCLLLLLGSITATAHAQTKVAPRKPAAPKLRMVSNGATMKDGVTVKEGKVLVTQQGLTSSLTQEMTLTNGTKISPAGAVTMANGSTVTMQEGDMLSLSGRLTTAAMKAEQDSLLMASKEPAKGKSKKKK